MCECVRVYFPFVHSSIDFLSFFFSFQIDFLTGENESRQNNGDPGSKNCICNDNQCICCVDFNISFIDLGGPGELSFQCANMFPFILYSIALSALFSFFVLIGCVRLKYLSPEEGIAINVSYGESLLHNEIVKGPDPPPSCLNIFAKLAQMCARFHGLLPTDDGMRGCIDLEPMLLGETQLQLPIGCFRMGPGGMEVIQSSAEVIKEQQPISNETSGAEEGPDSLGGLSAADLLAVVNESAETGIEFLSNWLGIESNATEDASSTDNDQSQQQQQLQSPPDNQYQQSDASENNGGGHVVFGSWRMPMPDSQSHFFDCKFLIYSSRGAHMNLQTDLQFAIRKAKHKF